MTTSTATRVVTETVHNKIADAADLANEYLTLAREAHQKMAALAERQEEVILNLTGNPDMVSYNSFFPKEGYKREQLNFENYYQEVVSTFLSLTANLVNRVYSVEFSFQDKELLTALFIEEGIDIERVYDAINIYLKGGSFADAKKQEAMAAFAALVEERRDWANSATGLNVTEKGNELIFPYLAREGWSKDNSISYETEAHLSTINRYVREVLGQHMHWYHSIPIAFGSAFVPDKGMNTTVKKIAVFKNGNLKISFASGADAAAFLAPVKEFIAA